MGIYSNASRCRYCGEEICWIEVNQGPFVTLGRKPIDPEPRADGTVHVPNPDTYDPRGRLVHTSDPVRPKYVLHTETCTHSRNQDEEDDR